MLFRSVISLSATSVTLNWALEPNSIAEYAVVEEGASLEEAQKYRLEDGSNQCTITGLLPSTTYLFYVRNSCSTGVASAWSSTNFTTKQLAATLPYSHSFEEQSENSAWSLMGSSINYFTIGSGSSYDGSKSLYITTNGSSHGYNDDEASYAYAYRTITFEPGSYDISFAWICLGETGYDYGRMFLVPEEIDFTLTGNSGITSPTQTPRGWINCMNGMVDNNDWTNEHIQVAITHGGNYNLLFYWYNDEMMGDQPPLAIDSIVIQSSVCADPMNLKTSVLSGSAAIISFISDADSVRVVVDTLSHSESSLESTLLMLDTIISGTSLQLSNLIAATTYYYWIQAYCGGDTLDWVMNSFVTDCAPYSIEANNSFSEDFNSWPSGASYRPECWRYESSYLSENYPCVISTATYAVSGNGFYHYISGSGDYSYVVTPEFVENISNLRVRLSHKSGISGQILRIGTMSDYDDYTTFEEICRVPTTTEFTDVNVLLNSYAGTAHRVVFAISESVSGVTGYYAMDNVLIEYIQGCSEPSLITLDTITENGAEFSWVAENDSMYTAPKYRMIILPSTASVADPSLAIVDTVVTGNSLQINGLLGSSSYKCYMNSICAEGDTSDWSLALAFRTECSVAGIPYSEEFSQFPPNCWSRHIGLAESIFNGISSLATTTNGWEGSTTNYGLNGSSAKLAILGTACNYWLVSPEINVSGPAYLSFDMALTTHNSNLPIKTANGQVDDKFMVVISTDAGLTWQTANSTEWNNSGDGDYVYNAISATGEKAFINLSPYQGMTIKIAFYGESTVAGVDQSNDLHIDNIDVKAVNSYLLLDDICDGYNYNGNGFNISRNDLDILHSPYTFERLSVNPNGMDSLVQLQLTIHPNITKVYNDTICSGDVYTSYGFNEISTGSYRLNFVSNTGCDSILLLNLTVLPRQEIDEERTVCESELPITWRGQTLRGSGTYYDTVNVIGGCGDVYILDLIVNPEYAVTEARSIKTSDMPYSYLDTVFNDITMSGISVHEIKRKTEAGCDSIITLTLDVDNDVSLKDIVSDGFDIYPNPIMRYGEVTIDANLTQEECEGMILEVFKSTGERVKVLYPEELPVYVDGFDASGIYIVRITTTRNKVIYGKVVVK